MAQSSALAVADADAPVFSLRPLKNQLQARYPQVKSSHLTEALACGLGFKTNAALRAEEARGPASWLPYKTLDTGALYRRLVEFGYPLLPDLRWGPLPPPPSPSERYLQRLQELRVLEHEKNPRWGLVQGLRDLCAQEFADTFGLGHLEDRDDERVAKRWTAGVDHGACLPGWGATFNSHNGGYVDFPGSDHRVHFRQALPLTNGKVAEYESARVSMPYTDGTGEPRELEAAALLAGRIGWTCTVLTDWSWYAPGSTALVLFKRTTPHEQVAKAWEHSFLRWMLDNRSLLLKRAGDTRRKVISDIIDDQHLPVDLVDYEDCRERYLKEFAPHLYEERDKGMAQVFGRLMDEWKHSLQGSEV